MRLTWEEERFKDVFNKEYVFQAFNATVYLNEWFEKKAKCKNEEYHQMSVAFLSVYLSYKLMTLSYILVFVFIVQPNAI